MVLGDAHFHLLKALGQVAGNGLKSRGFGHFGYGEKPLCNFKALPPQKYTFYGWRKSRVFRHST
jgi:hypothetical protein